MEETPLEPSVSDRDSVRYRGYVKAAKTDITLVLFMPVAQLHSAKGQFGKECDVRKSAGSKNGLGNMVPTDWGNLLANTQNSAPTIGIRIFLGG